MSSENNGGRVSVDLSGRKALVTGASRGIGRAIAIALAKAGAHVTCTATNAERLNEVVETIQAAGGQAEAVTCNVNDAEQVKEVVTAAAKKNGGLDIVVNNAGITADGLFMRMDDDQWDRVISTNLRGPFLVSRAAVRPLMKSKAGRVINISSVSGLMGNPGQANYSAAKAGLIGLTRTVAMELASRNVTVNAVAPGFIETDMTDEIPEEIREKAKEHIPLKRFGQPEDIADMVLFLASDAGTYITGQVMVVDGGMTT